MLGAHRKANKVSEVVKGINITKGFNSEQVRSVTDQDGLQIREQVL